MRGDPRFAKRLRSMALSWPSAQCPDLIVFPAMTKKLGLLVAMLFPIVAVTQARTCDRSCLESFVDQYLEALIAHDPQKLPMTPRVKNTEDGVRLDPGDGLWRTALAK